MTRIARPTQSLVQNARIDPKSLHINKPAAPAGSKTISEQKQDHFFPGGVPGSGGPHNSTWVDGGKTPGKKPLLTGSNPIKGDSFGADRINRRHQGGEMVGSKNDQVSTTFRVDAENDPSTVVKTEPKSPQQLTHEVAELKQEVAKLQDLVLKLLAEKEKNKTPNPEGNDAPSAPVTQQEIKTQRKGIPGPRTDGDDGRGGTQQAGSGGPMRDTTGQADGPVRERNTGTLNMDAVLKIDQLVNPQRH
ncbi:MAG: hypothetical protein QM817_04375 [Archangium sp.]